MDSIIFTMDFRCFDDVAFEMDVITLRRVVQGGAAGPDSSSAAHHSSEAGPTLRAGDLHAAHACIRQKWLVMARILDGFT